MVYFLPPPLHFLMWLSTILSLLIFFPQPPHMKVHSRRCTTMSNIVVNCLVQYFLVHSTFSSDTLCMVAIWAFRFQVRLNCLLHTVHLTPASPSVIREAGKSTLTSEPATLGDTTLQVDCSEQSCPQNKMCPEFGSFSVLFCKKNCKCWELT